MKESSFGSQTIIEPTKQLGPMVQLTRSSTEKWPRMHLFGKFVSNFSHIGVNAVIDVQNNNNKKKTRTHVKGFWQQQSKWPVYRMAKRLLTYISTTVDSTFSEYFAALKRTTPFLFRTTRSSVVTLPSRLDSWDRYKGLKRQGRKNDVNIDSSLWNREAIFSDVIRYPKMDIHRTV